jgi:hypothetical protein
MKGFERRHLVQRYLMILGKYLMREPIFSNYTLQYFERIAKMLKVPAFLIEFVKSILNYYRYYTYIS